MKLRTALGPAAAIVWLFLFATTVRAVDNEEFRELQSRYDADVRPLVRHYCEECHGDDLAEADVDLAAVKSFAEVRRHPRVWQQVREMLDSGQMPPKDAKQPREDELIALQIWVSDYLTAEAAARAGDPGRVVLRRLNNAEYTYTLRDLTGVATLDPAREFPVDGAAGEGFTNTGNALVMSPALVTKYLDAAKDVAKHAVLLPDGFRFSPHTSSRDWTEERLTQIRDFYRRFTDASGGDKVNLQGIVFDTNAGGRLPVEQYFAATLADREALQAGRKTVAAVAKERGLNAKYLGLLWSSLTSREPSLLLDGLRARWRTAKPEDAHALAAEVMTWQKGLWRFATVGHIGKVGGPKSWLEPVNPLIARQDVRFKIPASPDGQDVILSLVVTDAGDGNAHDIAVWQQPRLVAPGRPDLLLRDVRAVTNHLTAQRTGMLARTADYLAAAAEAAAATSGVDPADVARRHNLDAAGLHAWLDYFGIGSGGVELTGHLTTQLKKTSGHDFIQGWGSHDTPLLLANSSDLHVRVPGNMPPHSVAVHPSPTLRAAVGWRSPVAATLRLEGAVTHAHPECGNGVTWALELRRGATRRRLATGIAHGAQPVKFGPLENIAVQPGDLVSLLIGPRDGNHSCDLTTVELKLTSGGDGAQTWSLSEDVSGSILAGNPHADRFGHDRVWHFYAEPEKGGDSATVIPAESLLAKWLATSDPTERKKLAAGVQALLTSSTPAAKDSPDAALQRQLTSLGGPLFAGLLRSLPKEATTTDNERTDWGLDPALFGRHPEGGAVDAASLCVQAPSVMTIRLPADLAAGCELVTTGQLDPSSGAEGSVQMTVVVGQPAREAGLHPSTVTVTNAGGQWTGDNRRTAFGSPILVNDGSAARKRIEVALEEYRQLFPAALCYTKIVPVDEVVTLTLYYREDDHLQRLMLDDAQRAELDRLWDELHYISGDAVTLVDALEQLIQYATQDADPKVFEPLRQPFQDRANEYRQWLIDTEPQHWRALLDFAGRAYRRPLTAGEAQELRQLYGELRRLEFPHEDAFRLTLARVLVAPAFLYRLEQPGPGDKQQPVSDYEVASRLSYFLWSSLPDDELLRVAASGTLHQDDVLLAQLGRMLRDPKATRLASEFAGQWLHIHDFAQHDEKSERHFPTFAALRGAMAEESVLFFTDLFQNDGSVLSILDADHTFLNEDLAKHYGIPGVTGPEWRRVDDVRKHARGGILTQATTLATQSGASRTSPILRGNWLSEVILGEKLPRPPKNVPQLAETPPEGLTERQLIEKHSRDAACAKCHARIDPLGFALENFDAIGRHRERDAAGLRINSETQLPDGTKLSGLDGLRNYLVTQRRDAFVRQFNKKLLGYALGRSVQLSDEPLLAEMQATQEKQGYHVTSVLEMIVLSRQFREIRGREMPDDE